MLVQADRPIVGEYWDNNETSSYLAHITDEGFVLSIDVEERDEYGRFDGCEHHDRLVVRDWRMMARLYPHEGRVSKKAVTDSFTHLFNSGKITLGHFMDWLDYWNVPYSFTQQVAPNLYTFKPPVAYDWRLGIPVWDDPVERFFPYYSSEPPF